MAMSHFLKKLNELKNSLTIPTDDPAHDRSGTFKKERKNFIELAQWNRLGKTVRLVRCNSGTTVSTHIGKARWRTETVERDHLFLTRLGIAQGVAFSVCCLDFGYKV